MSLGPAITDANNWLKFGIKFDRQSVSKAPSPLFRPRRYTTPAKKRPVRIGLVSHFPRMDFYRCSADRWRMLIPPVPLVLARNVATKLPQSPPQNEVTLNHAKFLFITLTESNCWQRVFSPGTTSQDHLSDLAL